MSPWGPKIKLFLQCDDSFWRNIQISWTKLLHLSVSLLYNTLVWFMIYVKEKPFCLVNRAFPFVGPWELIYCSKVVKLFQSTWGLKSWKVNVMVPHQKGSCGMYFWQKNTCVRLCGLKIQKWANFSTVFMKILKL